MRCVHLSDLEHPTVTHSREIKSLADTHQRRESPSLLLESRPLRNREVRFCFSTVPAEEKRRGKMLPHHQLLVHTHQQLGKKMDSSPLNKAQLHDYLFILT